MKILFHQFLSANHSWAVVGRGLATALIKQGHEVHLFSTDGGKLPTHLQPHLIGYTEENGPTVFGRIPDNNYDCQISYTAMKNFPMFLGHGNKNRFGIFCYEFAGKNALPTGFAKNYKNCDKLIPPSNFAKEVFLQSGIPENAMTVIPHGVNEEYCIKNTKITLPTNKKFKILANVAQLHLRKGLPELFEAYGQAFDKNDDVCLILKGKNKPKKFPFDVSLDECIRDFKKNYPNHAELKIFSKYLDDLSDLYRSVDATFTTTKCEGFWVPGIESLCSGKLCIASRYGGQLDFLNDENSLLIDGKVDRAPAQALYWEPKPNTIWFKPSIESAVKQLQYAFHNYETINAKLELQREEVYKKYSWDTVAEQFMNLCQ